MVRIPTARVDYGEPLPLYLCHVSHVYAVGGCIDSHPGIFLSQPGIEILASWAWAQVVVSTLSAMISLLWRENRMPMIPSSANEFNLVVNQSWYALNTHLGYSW